MQTFRLLSRPFGPLSPFRPCLLPAFVLLMGLIGCQTEAGDEAEEDALPTEPVPVRVAVAKTTTLHPSVQLVGTLQAIPERTAIVSPRIGGWIDRVLVVDGHEVEAAAELLKLDARVAQVELKRAEAAIQQKQAVLDRLKHGYLPQEIEMARQQAYQSQQTLEGLKVEFAALESLHDKNEVSPVQYQATLAKLRAGEAAAKAANARLELLQAGTRPEDITEAKANLAVAQAERDAAQLNLAFCTVTSPIAGIVTQMIARRGTFLERASPVATIVDVSELFAKVRVPGDHFDQVHPNQHADVRLPSLPDRVFPGTVARMSGQADPNTGHIDAFIRVQNADDRLRPGLACKVTVSLPERADVLTIPIAAAADHSGTSVVTVVREGKAFEVPVRLGVQTENNVEVLAGLKPGDVVATEGGYGLPDGCPVRTAADPKPDQH